MRDLYWNTLECAYVFEINGYRVIDRNNIVHATFQKIGTNDTFHGRDCDLEVVTKNVDKLLRILYEI